MKFLLAHQLKQVAKAKQLHLSASALDRHCTLQTKSDIKRLLVSKKGLVAAFSAGVAKGLVSQSDKSSKSELAGLMKMLVAL
ncbi:hypothetical protein FGD67_10490 [Colwellia sp. M166]|uniref:hypothetical protein n=1 Tax=Colwellia sp. M166 TaxID=2583805 RepID=UPI00211E77DA|nr:hypothetical protein [Colwellia sp. M166]UUO23611.1 hypothetical protein FGD67_10490 [Colwellia sp. M166]|tara:strand:+ start:1417 stop:1662 length:246 start_codon:yes stop_codon:yes gene_type:complete